METIEMAEIQKLIKAGFDLELISFELDIPIETVRQCQQDLVNRRAMEQIGKREQYKRRSSGCNDSIESKITQMKQKYSELYYSKDEIETVQFQPLSEEDNEFVQTVIEMVEGKIEEMAAPHITRKNKCSILAEVQKLQEYELSIEQAEKLYELLGVEELKGMGQMVENWLAKLRRVMVKKLANAIDYEQYQTEDIETLESLSRRIKGEMMSRNALVIEPVKNKILNRINKLKQRQAIDRIKNNIPASILTIIGELANGNMDMQKANEVIDEEVKRRMANKPKTLFSLTEEQERKQILRQITIGIVDRAEQYPIQNPEVSAQQIQELCGESEKQSISLVIRNFITRKDFETAKKVCNEFLKTEEGNEITYRQTYIRELKNEIRNAEIGDGVMSIIRGSKSIPEERKWFEALEEGIDKGYVKLVAVPLGKSKDGEKNITLADIWINQNEKHVAR